VTLSVRRDLDAPWKQSARALPIPVSPVRYELLISYIRRLAAANHTDPLLLIDHLGRRHQHPQASGVNQSDYDLTLNHAALDRLATYSGSPTTSYFKLTAKAPSASPGSANKSQFR
jgi:hypothetical protein